MIHGTKKNGQKGFTLVEVIVVAVIVAALAGVAVPVYLGYVDNSRTNSATNVAGAVAAFMGSCRNSAGVPDDLAAASDAAVGPIAITCTLNPVPPGGNPVINIPPRITVTRTAAGTCVTAAHADGGAASQPFCF
jgi:prepilin-type N-terminal cleavage/methylation domain-containing protein